MSALAVLPGNNLPSERVAGFVAQLRLNGFKAGPAEAEAALRFLVNHDALDRDAVRLALKAMLTGERELWERFDLLFESYWYRRGRVRPAVEGATTVSREVRRLPLWQEKEPPEAGGSGPEPLAARSGEEERDSQGAEGRLIATPQRSIAQVDLRKLVTPQDIAEAEATAERLARAIRYRMSRRRRVRRRGESVDLRRTIRRNLSRGAEPIDLLRRNRPPRPANLVLLVDVSGSMKVYARYLLAFVRGLLNQSLRADAYLFHTGLVRVTDAFRDPDPLRAMMRLSLLAEGFGGGTRIAASLKAFNERYAKSALDSRSVVIVMSDGYDCDPPEALVAELKRLKQRARRLVWLNPLLGWRDYAPVARGMAASLPYIDLFATAHTLESLAALEGELGRL